MSAQAEERSRLHDRVRGFIEESTGGGETKEDFERLALAVAAYQAERVPAYARLLAASNVHPKNATTLRQLPAVPTDAFRFARIAAHPPSDDVAHFRTSGTTAGPRGEHALSTTKTYERAALTWGRWALFFDAPPPMSAIILGSRDDGQRDSSLDFMIDLFADRFARAVRRVTVVQGVSFDRKDLETAFRDAVRAAVPTVVMATSFAFVHALEALGSERFVLPPGSRVMHTGGFKGRSREVPPDVLRSEIASALGVDAGAVVGEYGMTELSSQLYEGTLRARLGAPTPSAEHGRFVPPPWLRVRAVDPETLAPLAPGEVGILRFEDLANVDSAIAVQTADRGRCSGTIVELLGRSEGALPRGCSLSIEELLASP